MDERDKTESKKRRRRFRRSKEYKIISGFCGGLGEYFDIDPVLIRLGFLAVFLFAPAGLGFVLFYIIGAIVTPMEKVEQAS